MVTININERKTKCHIKFKVHATDEDSGLELTITELMLYRPNIIKLGCFLRLNQKVKKQNDFFSSLCDSALLNVI